MPLLSEEERKKGQERGQAYTTVTGGQLGALNQQAQQQQQSQTVEQRTEQALQPPQQYQQFTPTPENGARTFDYRTAQTDLQGRPLPAGAEGFDPMGRPYFGPGLKGTLKRYYYNLMGEPSSGLGAENWKNLIDLTKQIENKPIYAQSEESKAASVEFGKRSTAQLFGFDVNKTTEADKQKVAELDKQLDALSRQLKLSPQQAARDPQYAALLAQRRELIGKNVEGKGVIEIGGQNVSLLTPVVRASKVGVSALMDILQEPAIKFEQAQGVARAIQEAGEGSPLPEITTRNELGDAALRLLAPVLQSYNSLRFFTAPLTNEQRIELVKKGWNEGRILYSELVEPAIRDEYIRRAEAGEDTQLLAMELQNPWAEMAGQIVLDPLNVLGMLGKAAKVGNTIDDVSDIVKTSGLASDAKFLDEVNDLQHASSAADAQRKIDILASTVQDFFFTKADDGTLAAKVIKPQSYKPLALSAEGNRIRTAKEIGNVMTWGMGNIYREGRALDDVNDWLTGLVKLSSENIDEVRQGIATLSNFPSAKTNFGESFLETSRMLRNVLRNNEGVLDYAKITKKIEAAAGDWDALGLAMRGLIDDATKTQFPTISELKKAADVAEEARLTGKAVPNKTQELANTFKEIEKSNPGAVRIAELNEVASKPKNAVNNILGKFYFSYQYGVGARNFIQNNLITLIDAGPRAWYRDGKFWSDAAITDELSKWHGGQLPPAAAGFKTLPSSIGAKSDKLFGILPSGSAIMEKGEVSAAKRVYYKFFRDTIDRMIKPGVGLPNIEDFKAVGMTEQQVGHFTQMVKNNYGDVKAAMRQFDEVYKNGGPDMWRMLDDYIPPQQVSALKDAGIYDELIEFTRKSDVSREDVSKLFEGMRTELKGRAGSIVDDIPGMSDGNPAKLEVANFTERAGDNLSTGDKARLDVLIEAGYQAHDELIQALTEIGQKTNDPEVIQVLGSLAERTPDNIIRKTTKQITDAAWEVSNKSRKRGANLMQLAEEAGMTGVIPTTPAEFRRELWKQRAEKVTLEWSNYFNRTFEVSSGVAEKYGSTDKLRIARTRMLELQEYRTATFSDDLKIFRNPQLVEAELGTPKHADNIRSIANQYGISSASQTGAPTGDKLLNIVNKGLETPFEKLDDVPLDVAEEAFARSAKVEVKGLATGTALEATEQIPAPYVDGAYPVPSRMNAENYEGMLETINNVERQMLNNWGLKAGESYTPTQAQAMRNFAKVASDRMAEGQLIAQKVGEYWRDFALLPYGETTHLDHAMSYVYPYQFWYSRSYKTWMERLASDPQIISAYAKFKDKMASAHKEAPEWWRYNVSFPDFLGLNNGNPMFINLEAALWPLYGLTGVDFNDPYKRTNWLTSTVDDLGKFGPSMWAPIQWAMAAGLSLNGEKEAAARWGGRAIPQTSTIKSLMAVAGVTPKEFDPAVQIFSGSGLFDTSAVDPYERNRVGRALSAMVQDGSITQEQAIDVARTQEGPVWDEALLRATNLRAPGQISSFFLGVGFKARTPEDIEVDNFYSDYGRLQNLNRNGFISPEEYKKSFDVLRERYPFMDTVLLSRRAGDERDSAYAYNVLGRIPPGQSREIYELTGIDPDLAAQFYESGGKFEGWKETDKQKFIAGMVEAGALLAIPPTATKQEWTDARLAYKDMQAQIKAVLGDDIYNAIDVYYAIQDRDQAKLYLDSHPEVSQAMDLQTQLIVQTPNLMEYYGGLDTLERFYYGKVYDQLEKQFGKDITTKEQVYFDLKLQEELGTIEKGTAKQYIKDNNLDDYWDAKSQLKDSAFRNVVTFGSKLPEAPETFFRPEAQAPQPQAPVDWNAVLGGPMLELIQISYATGEDLPQVVQSELEYLSGRYGYSNSDDMLRDVLIDLVQ